MPPRSYCAATLAQQVLWQNVRGSYQRVVAQGRVDHRVWGTSSQREGCPGAWQLREPPGGGPPVLAGGTWLPGTAAAVVAAARARLLFKPPTGIMSTVHPQNLQEGTLVCNVNLIALEVPHRDYTASQSRSKSCNVGGSSPWGGPQQAEFG